MAKPSLVAGAARVVSQVECVSEQQRRTSISGRMALQTPCFRARIDGNGGSQEKLQGWTRDEMRLDWRSGDKFFRGRRLPPLSSPPTEPWLELCAQECECPQRSTPKCWIKTTFLSCSTSPAFRQSLQSCLARRPQLQSTENSNSRRTIFQPHFGQGPNFNPFSVVYRSLRGTAP
jgi:hypothetical protein